MMSAVAAEAASDLVRKVYPVCTADANAVWSCSFGALGASRASSPRASGWCGCIRPVQSSENTVMEHLPQRGNVGCCVLFHTPRLRNTVKCDEMYAEAALVSLQGRLCILSPSRASQLPQTAMGPCAPAEGRVRRPPITPPWSTGFLPCCSLTPFPCHHAVYRSPSVDSG